MTCKVHSVVRVQELLPFRRLTPSPPLRDRPPFCSISSSDSAPLCLSTPLLAGSGLESGFGGTHRTDWRVECAWGHRLELPLRELMNSVNASSLASGLSSRPREKQEFTGTCLRCADSTHPTHPSVELSMFVAEEAQPLMRLPTKHSIVQKPSQAAGCSRSHVAAFSFALPMRSTIEALATIE